MLKVFKLGIVGKISLVSILLVLFSVSSIMVVGYFVNYSNLDKAAGEELIGCANITTGLVDSSQIEAIKKGDNTNYDQILAKVNWTVDHKPIFLNSSIMTLDGKLLVPDSRLTQQGYKRGDSFYVDPKAIAMLQQMKHAEYSELYTFGGIKRKTGYAPIFKDNDSSKEIIALMTVDFQESVIAQRTMNMLRVTLALGGIFPILAGIIGFVYARRMARPIIVITQSMELFAKGDLTVPEIRTTSQDEVGKLSQTYNAMVQNIRNNILKVATNAEQLATSTQQISLITEDLSKGSQMQAESVEIVSEMVREMNRAVNSVAKNTEQVVNYFEKTMETGNKGTAVIRTMLVGMQDISGKMGDLSNLSGEINEIVEVIDSIAEQTNLLSLNAAIEAARAGEAGRGFTVVAEEVRKLAERSSQATKKISQLISSVQVNTEVAVKAVNDGNALTRNAGEAFDQIITMVKEASDRVTEIAAASEEQASQSSVVMSNMESISSVVQLTTAGMTETASKSIDLAAMAKSLNQIASGYKMG